MSNKSGQKGSGGKQRKSKTRVAKCRKRGAATSPGKPKESPTCETAPTRDHLAVTQVSIYGQANPTNDQVLLSKRVVTLKNAPPLTRVPPLKPLKKFAVAKPTLPSSVDSVFLRILLIVATLVWGLIGLVPRTNLTVSNPVDPADPFSSLVTVTNTGYLPLSAVTWQMALQKVSARDGGVSMEGAPNYTTRFRRPDWPLHRLGAGDQLTFALNEVFHACREGLRSADIAIIVEYEIPLIHLRVEKLYPLAAKSQTDGNFYWYSNSQTLPAGFSFPRSVSPGGPAVPLRSLPALERSSFVEPAPLFSSTAVR